jgi:hypothetical protein
VSAVATADRRLAALAAALAGDRAPALLSRLATPGTAAAAALAARLAAAPRAERLRALSAELAVDPREVRARAEAAAADERAAVARLLTALPVAGTGRAAPLLVRLCRERVSA